MRYNHAQAFFAEMQGQDLELAYANAFMGKVVGGLRDGGLDVLTGDNRIPHIQVKSSLGGLKDFLGKSLQFKHFIPVCVGEPGEREEMIQSLLEFGIWVGSDIPDRYKIQTAVKHVRYMCTA